jgi:hypothetical protein
MSMSSAHTAIWICVWLVAEGMATFLEEKIAATRVKQFLGIGLKAFHD